MKKIIRATTVPQSLNTFCKGMLMDLSKDYEVIALSSPGEALKWIEEREGVRTIAVPMERQISLFKDVKALISLIKVFHRERPDMVHSMTPKAGLLCMVAAKCVKVPVRVHTFTGLVFPTSKGIKKRILMLTDKITCACATHIIPEGEGVKNDLITNRITGKELKVLGYGNVRGVDMGYYDKSSDVMEKARSLYETGKFSFLFVGRIVRDKGIDELVSAFLRLNHERPQIRLFLVGSYDNDSDPISYETREAIDAYQNIAAVGRKTGPDLLAYFAMADCFVFPSYREGFPNTVLEAGAFNLPSIVTDINGSREIIRDGYNGIIIPPHDVDALYDAMKRIIDNPELRQSMASVARKHIATYFEQGFVRKCLYDFYKSVL